MFVSEVIHSALVVLGELAARENNCGISSKQIAQKKKNLQANIEKIVIELVNIGFVQIRNRQGDNTACGSEKYLFVAKHSDEIYVSDVVEKFNKKEFKGWYVDANGEELPPNRLSSCINQLRWRGEQFLERQMSGVSINVLATWSSFKKEELI